MQWAAAKLRLRRSQGSGGDGTPSQSVPNIGGSASVHGGKEAEGEQGLGGLDAAWLSMKTSCGDEICGGSPLFEQSDSGVEVSWEGPASPIAARHRTGVAAESKAGEWTPEKSTWASEVLLSDAGLSQAPRGLRRLNISCEGLRNMEVLSDDERFAREAWLHGNCFAAFPGQLKRMPYVQKLRLDDNNITSVPLWVGALSCLTQLRLDDNAITGELSAALGECGRLEALSISRNRLKSVSTQLPPMLTRLRTLDLDGNMISSLPDTCSALTSVTALNLDSNHLVDLGFEVGQLSAMTKLRIGHNKLCSLPANLGSMYNLVEFACEHNHLPSLPPSLGTLARLERVICKFYGCKRNLTHTMLRQLSCYENEEMRGNVPQEVLCRGKTTIMAYLKSLYEANTTCSLALLNFQLRDVHFGQSGFESLLWTKLERLVLDRNKLFYLPVEIQMLTGLKCLSAEHNRLTTVPPSVGTLSQLRILALQNNCLQALPDSMRCLVGLEELLLEANQLTDIPLCVRAMSNLQDLRVDSNKLDALPDFLSELQQLRVLSVQRNALIDVPGSLTSLTNLEIFRVSANALTALRGAFVNWVPAKCGEATPDDGKMGEGLWDFLVGGIDSQVRHARVRRRLEGDGGQYRMSSPQPSIIAAKGYAQGLRRWDLVRFTVFKGCKTGTFTGRIVHKEGVWFREEEPEEPGELQKGENEIKSHEDEDDEDNGGTGSYEQAEREQEQEEKRRNVYMTHLPPVKPSVVLKFFKKWDPTLEKASIHLDVKTGDERESWIAFTTSAAAKRVLIETKGIWRCKDKGQESTVFLIQKLPKSEQVLQEAEEPVSSPQPQVDGNATESPSKGRGGMMGLIERVKDATASKMKFFKKKKAVETKVPDEELYVEKRVAFGSLTDLDLSNNMLTGLPKYIGRLTRLTALRAVQNELTKIPNSLCSLGQLQRLDLCSNNLSGLPLDVGKLTGLQSLDVSHNSLSGLPATIAFLGKNLTELRINDNMFEGELPFTVWRLTSLQTLCVSNNPITKVSEDLGFLADLRRLLIDGTRVSELPRSMVYLYELRELWMQGCSATVRLDVARLPQLRQISLCKEQMDPAMWIEMRRYVRASLFLFV